MILLAYLAASDLITMRTGVLPGNFGWGAWLPRFVLRSLTIRPAALLACLFLGIRNGGLRRWGWHWRLAMPGLLVAAAASAAFAALYLARVADADFPFDQQLVGWLAVVPVAILEETLFRGFLFLSLRPRLGPFAAALASSLIFACYHVAGVESWPSIFMWGFCACAAVHGGLGLAWLMALHFLVNAAWFVVGADFRLPVARPWVFWSAMLALYAACVAAIRMLTREESLAEIPGRS